MILFVDIPTFYDLLSANVFTIHNVGTFFFLGHSKQIQKHPFHMLCINHTVRIRGTELVEQILSLIADAFHFHLAADSIAFLFAYLAMYLLLRVNGVTLDLFVALFAHL